LTKMAVRAPGKGGRRKAARNPVKPSLPIGRPVRLAHLVPGSDRQLRRSQGVLAGREDAETPKPGRSENPTPSSVSPSGPGADPDILALPNPEWLPHCLAVSGPHADVAAFQRAAAGPGGIPWIVDYDRMEEDWGHGLLAPSPAMRGISVEGARVLTRRLRDVVAVIGTRAEEAAYGDVSCPLDLHCLVPVPDRILRLGPDDPVAIAWLWQHWGTTWALRGVEEALVDDVDGPIAAGLAAIGYRFWSADWTPWRAIAVMRSRWPSMAFEVNVRAVSE
jgi:hypothetical protein